MKGFQPYIKVLDSETLTFGTHTEWEVAVGRKLPHHVGQGIAHLVGFLVEADLDPTFTTAPTTFGVQASVAKVVFHDGIDERISCSMNDLRVAEILENQGRVLMPDPDTSSGSTNNFYFRRYITIGPSGFIGAPSDFLLPCAAIPEATLKFHLGALTDISADTTAATLALRVSAVMVPLWNELRVPPLYQRRAYAGAANKAEIAGSALYPLLWMADAATYAAISAGDFGAITLNGAQGPIISAVDAETLGALFHAVNRTGQLSPVQGEPRAATDDNPKVVNSGTPTALVAPTAAIQAVLFPAEAQRIEKIGARSLQNLELSWAGSQATAHIGVGRMLERTDGGVATLIANACAALKVSDKPDQSKVKTVTKTLYTGHRGKFMPLDIAVG